MSGSARMPSEILTSSSLDRLAGGSQVSAVCVLAMAAFPLVMNGVGMAGLYHALPRRTRYLDSGYGHGTYAPNRHSGESRNPGGLGRGITPVCPLSTPGFRLSPE